MRTGGKSPGRAGRFELSKLLGEGAFAQVWAGESAGGERAAVKILVSDADQARERFLREIKVLQSLPKSRHVVGYVADGELSDGTLWVALELIDGYPLSQIMVPGTRIKAKQACALLLQLSEAFAGLHRLGLTHGDIKPQNVMITKGGQSAKLLDFGLVRDAQGLLGVLQREGMETGDEFVRDIDMGMLMGTPEYMAPELISDARLSDPSQRRTDTPSDVFGLGVIFYELLSGRKPFPFSPGSPRTWKKDMRKYFDQRLALDDDALPPIEGVDGSLMSIVAKALRQNPRHRQGNAVLLAIDIRTWLREGRGVGEEADDTIASLDAKSDLSEMAAAWRADAAVAKRAEDEREAVGAGEDSPSGSDRTTAPPLPPQSILERAVRGPGWKRVLAGAFALGLLVGAVVLWLLSG